MLCCCCSQRGGSLRDFLRLSLSSSSIKASEVLTPYDVKITPSSPSALHIVFKRHAFEYTTLLSWRGSVHVYVSSSVLIPGADL